MRRARNASQIPSHLAGTLLLHLLCSLLFLGRRGLRLSGLLRARLRPLLRLCALLVEAVEEAGKTLTLRGDGLLAAAPSAN